MVTTSRLTTIFFPINFCKRFHKLFIYYLYYLSYFLKLCLTIRGGIILFYLTTTQVFQKRLSLCTRQPLKFFVVNDEEKISSALLFKKKKKDWRVVTSNIQREIVISVCSLFKQ